MALVDDEDHPMLSQYKWCLKKDPHDTVGYAKTYVKGRVVYMHQMLLPEALRVDHRDGNALNNQHYNLRGCTHQQNMQNQKPHKGKRFKGIYFRKYRQHLERPWQAFIKYDGAQRHIGYFATEEEAARAYDREAREHFGEFAWLNFPDVPRKEMGRAEEAVVASIAEVA